MLVVDDEALVRDGLAAIVASDPDLEVAGTAADGDEAVRAAVAHRPDVVLMDVRMPGTDGIDATREVLRAVPTTRLVTTVDWTIDLRAAARGRHGRAHPRPREARAWRRTGAAGPRRREPRAHPGEWAARRTAGRTPVGRAGGGGRPLPRPRQQSSWRGGGEGG